MPKAWATQLTATAGKSMQARAKDNLTLPHRGPYAFRAAQQKGNRLAASAGSRS